MLPEVHHELLTSFRLTSSSVVGVDEDLGRSHAGPGAAPRRHTSLAIVLAKPQELSQEKMKIDRKSIEKAMKRL